MHQANGAHDILCVLTQQVAGGMEMGKEDSDEEKIAALSAAVAVGKTVFVKVVEIKEHDGSGRCGTRLLFNVASLLCTRLRSPPPPPSPSLLC